MEKMKLIFGVIFAIGAIALLITIFLDAAGPSANCNLEDYKSGSHEWYECLEAKAEHPEQQPKTYDSPEYCDSFESQKGGCYIRVAENTNDYSICETYKTDIEKTIGGMGRCFEGVATQNSNIAACDRAAQVELDSNKTTSDDCYSALAYEMESAEPCKKIQEEERMQTCIENIEKYYS